MHGLLLFVDEHNWHFCYAFQDIQIQAQDEDGSDLLQQAVWFYEQEKYNEVYPIYPDLFGR